MADQGRKVFTLEEANAHLPTIRMHFGRIFVLQDRLREVGEALRKMGVDILAGQWRYAESDPPDIARLKNAFLAHLDETNALLADIQANGAMVKDIHRGHVDFYGKVEGEVVCLCWQYGEDDIEYWHDVDAGLAGRVALFPGSGSRLVH